MALRHDLGLDVFYYILHRDGVPFTNMMNIEYRGVGLYGHVFTKPEDRQKGAASALMPMLMDDFRARGGKALYLGTGYDSHPPSLCKERVRRAGTAQWGDGILHGFGIRFQ
jgi:hypothetical protein